MNWKSEVLGIAAGVLLAAGVAGSAAAHGMQWPGWGMMGQGNGWCPMMGQAMGPGMMGPGMMMSPGMMGPGMMGPGMMGPGMMGPGMMGQGMMGQGMMGPGSMGSGMMGPGMMGPGMMGQGMMGGGPAAASLTVEDVKSNLERWLAWQGNPRLKVGNVSEKDKATITAEIVTVDNSLVQKLEVDRRTGMMWPSDQ